MTDRPAVPSQRGLGSRPADRADELEQVVERLARLALHASAVAERIARLPLPPSPDAADRDARLRRLSDATERCRAALLAATATELQGRGAGLEVPVPARGGRLRRLVGRHGGAGSPA